VASNSTEAPGRMVGTLSSASSAASCDANALLSTFRAPLFFRMVTTGDPIDEGLIIQAHASCNASRGACQTAFVVTNAGSRHTGSVACP
jgi:hypothetical protein